jgi:hypothetical protein
VPKKGQFTEERVEYNVFLFEEPLKASKSLKIFKISLTFRFDTGENSQILIVSNKKIVYTIRDQSAIFQLAILSLSVWIKSLDINQPTDIIYLDFKKVCYLVLLDDYY